MTSDDFLLVIDQKGHVESERIDTLSNLPDLFVAMNPGVSWVGFQRCRTEICNLQRCCRQLHRVPPLLAELQYHYAKNEPSLDRAPTAKLIALSGFKFAELVRMQ